MDWTAVLASLQTAGTVFFWIIIVLIPLVIVHEFGHSIMAWLTKVRVVEFGVGIPPRTPLSVRKKGLLWSVNWLPIGGFAKIYGDHDALDSAVNDPQKTLELTKSKYHTERMLEVVDADLEALLSNNGIPWSADWALFEKYLRNNPKLLRHYLDTGSVPETMEDQYQKKLKQVSKLIEWELDGMKKHKSAFYNRNVFVKTLILVGGVLFNYLFAWILLAGLLAFGTIERLYVVADDLPKSNYLQIISTQLSDKAIISSQGPLGKAGIENESQIKSIGGKKLEEYTSFEEVRKKIQESQGNPIQVEAVLPNQKGIKTVSVIPEKQDGNYRIGITLVSKAQFKAKDALSLPAAATEETNRIVSETVKGLSKVFSGLWNGAIGKQTQEDKEALEQVGGPIRIGGYSALIYDLLGTGGIVYAMAAFSIGLAVANLLPLPVLDGGRILIVWLNAITRRRNKKLEGIIISGTMVLLLTLFVFMAVRDSGFVNQLLSR